MLLNSILIIIQSMVSFGLMNYMYYNICIFCYIRSKNKKINDRR